MANATNVKQIRFTVLAEKNSHDINRPTSYNCVPLKQFNQMINDSDKKLILSMFDTIIEEPKEEIDPYTKNLLNKL